MGYDHQDGINQRKDEQIPGVIVFCFNRFHIIFIS
jgi:hypothetical protein